MTDIPEDIRRKAGDAILAGGEVLRCGGKLHTAIAQALMEERGANARRVNEMLHGVLLRDRRAIKRDLVLQWLAELESAIRNPTP